MRIEIGNNDEFPSFTFTTDIPSSILYTKDVRLSAVRLSESPNIRVPNNRAGRAGRAGRRTGGIAHAISDTF